MFVDFLDGSPEMKVKKLYNLKGQSFISAQIFRRFARKSDLFITTKTQGL